MKRQTLLNIFCLSTAVVSFILLFASCGSGPEPEPEHVYLPMHGTDTSSP